VKAKRRKHRRGAQKRTRIVKRSLSIDGSKTSVTLEDAFQNALREIAAVQNIHVSELVSTIKIELQPGSDLSSAIRLFILDCYQRSARWRPTPSSRPADDARQHARAWRARA
jgi:predicted DNA-binding ribbon-helix-helix protein